MRVQQTPIHYRPNMVGPTALAALAAIGIALSGCATVFEGTSQEITVVTNPAGAVCVFERQGYEVGRVANTPGTANIRKSKYDITIKCDKPGYAEASYLNHSGTTATIAANVAADLILTAGISSIVDSADGADNKYDSAVNISLTPISNLSYVLPESTLARCTEQDRAQDQAFMSVAKEKGVQYRPRCS
jgi:hypothetical protein